MKLLRTTFLSLALSAFPAHAQDNWLISVPDGDSQFQLPETFYDLGAFEETEVSKKLAANAVSFFSHTLDSLGPRTRGFDAFLGAFKPEDFNLEELPQSLDAREIIFQLNNREYYARLFPRDSEQHTIVKELFFPEESDASSDGVLDDNDLEQLVNLVVSSEIVRDVAPIEEFVDSFSSNLTSSQIDFPNLNERVAAVVEPYYPDLLYHRILFEVGAGVYGQDYVAQSDFLARARSFKNIDDEIYWRLEREGLGVKLDNPLLVPNDP